MSFLLAAVLLGAAIYAGARIGLRQMVNRQLAAAVQNTPGLDDIQYEHLEIRLRPLGLELVQVTLKSSGSVDPIPIRRAKLTRFTPGQALPRQLSVFLDDIRIPATHPALEPLRAPLQRLALKSLDMDLDLRLVQVASQAKAWRGQVELQVQQAGTLRVALAVDNLDMDGVLRAIDHPVNWMTVLPPTGIRAMALEYEDDGLVDRMVVDRARRTGQPPAAARQHFRQTIEAAARREKILPLGRLLSTFVADPIRIGYYTGNSEPVYLGRLLWARRIGGWLHPLEVRGYRASTPRVNSWVTSTAAIPEKPPQR
jgi:hypothetical protein